MPYLSTRKTSQLYVSTIQVIIAIRVCMNTWQLTRHGRVSQELRLLYILRDSRLYPFGIVVVEIVLRKRVLDHNMHVDIITKVCMEYKLFLMC